MRGIPGVLALAVFSTFFAVACEDSKTAVKVLPPPPAVDVVSVVKSKVAPVNEFIGQTKAQDTVDLVARIEGFLTKRNFIEGQMVKSGDLLLQIEKDQYDADVEKAQGALAAVQAKLKDAQITYDRQATLWKQA